MERIILDNKYETEVCIEEETEEKEKLKREKIKNDVLDGIKR